MKPKFERDSASGRSSRWQFEVRILAFALVLAALLSIPVLSILAAMAGFERILGEALANLLGGVLDGLASVLLMAVGMVIAILYVIYLVLIGDWTQVVGVLKALFEWLRSAGLG
jgi:hypothetical protein